MPSTSRPKKGTPKRRSIFWRQRRPLFLAGLLIITAVAGVGYTLAQIELPDERVQSQTTFVCAADVTQGCKGDNAIASFHGEVDRTYVELNQIPQVMVDAVIAAEDRDFFKHGGIDPFGIMRALWNDIRNESTQGGSTITQQYVKQVYLFDEATARSGLKGLSRKVREAVMAVKLEQELTKEQILERYLNTIYLGRGAYGVSAAVRNYFGHDLAQVTVAEAAYLAGLIPSPETADAIKDPAEATVRRQGVLDAMLEMQKITQQQHDEAAVVPWVEGQTILRHEARRGFGPVKGAEFGMEYVRDYVFKQLKDKGFSDAEIYGGGLRVYTTIDLGMQEAAYESVMSTLDQPDDPRAGLVALDPNGHVKAMFGGTAELYNSGLRGAQVNVAVPPKDGGGSGWQPGSSFKPFVLAAALQQGISMKSFFSGPAEITIPKANAGGPWKVHNAEPSESGALNLIDATRHSVNTVFAQLMVKVGAQNAVDVAKQMGISVDLPVVNSLVLGAGEVSPLDMASGYSTFAHRGLHIKPTIITRVERPDGTFVQFDQAQTQVLDPGIADQVNYALRGVVTGGTGSGADPGFTVAGKTGTTDSYKNAWFVGYTPSGWTVAAAMGYDPEPDAEGSLQPRYMTSVHGRKAYGGTFPATMFRKFMERALDGVDVGKFEEPGAFGGKVLNPDLATTTTTSTTTTSTTAPTTSAPPPPGPPTTPPPTTAQLPETSTTKPPIN